METVEARQTECTSHQLAISSDEAKKL